MAVKTRTELKAQIDADIKVNGNREITPPKHNSIETNIIDSYVNVSDGGNVMAALFGQSVYIAPNDDKHYAPKKYVDDEISAIVIPTISDVAYDATTWDANTDGATKNAIRDKFVSVDAAIAAAYYPDLTGNTTVDFATFYLELTGGELQVKRNAVIGSTSTPTNVIPLVVDANSSHATYLLALGKNGNSAYFRVNESGNVTDIGGGTAPISSANGKPYFNAGIIFTDVESTQDGDAMLTGNTSSGTPWAITNSSTTDNQVTFSVNGNNAATKGNIQNWRLFGNTVVSSVSPAGDFVLEDSTLAYYIGNRTTNGSWRIRINGTDIHFERREAGVWVSKGNFTA